MPVINHTPRDFSSIRKTDGSPLYGEIAMYKRILSDLDKDDNEWHFFYDLNLNIRVGNKSHIQIDFLLICEEGAIVVEVKGGVVSIQDGKYYTNNSTGGSIPLAVSPYDQAEGYRNALWNNHILNKNEVSLEFVCAFPFTPYMDLSDTAKDYSEQTWYKDAQDDSNASFADFCLDFLKDSKAAKSYVDRKLSKIELNRLIGKLAPTVCNSNGYTESTVDEILDWLHIDDVNTLESLSKNQRLVIEGGPGTGKTTIAKAYIKKYSSQRGLYLCKNALLAEKMRYQLKEECISTCDVSQYDSFILSLSNHQLNLEDIANAGNDVGEKVSTVIQNYKDSPHFQNYNYIIIDEAQDILDQGADIVLDKLSSIGDNGLQKGRYLVFYDTDQGYRSHYRKLDSFAERISANAALFRMLENKRVGTNNEIYHFSEKVREAQGIDELTQVLSEIESQKGLPIELINVDGATELYHEVSSISSKVRSENRGNDYVLLTHSCVDKLKMSSASNAKSFLDVLKICSTPLDKTNVNKDNSSKFMSTTMLKYKGLECKHVILVVKPDQCFDNYELFVGMSRAIMDLKIILIK